MGTSLVDADSILAIDIGTVFTRTALFDVVEGRYRFLGAGTAPTTAGAPTGDVSEGVREAIRQLQDITGRILLDPGGQLATPTKPDGTGVDACVATVSAGPPLKAVVIGLLEDISTESAQNLASTTYVRVVETMSLNDRRKTVSRLDTLLRIRPDLVVVAGGTDGGASGSVINLLEAVGLACYLLPKEQRPEVLFAGNATLTNKIKEHLGSLASLHIAPNVRPTLDIEQLTPSQPALSQVFRHVRSRQMRGIQEVDLWTGGRLMPTATALGRTIRFIGKEYAKTKKGVLGIDVGASATTVASAFAGDLILGIYPELGLGENLPDMLKLCQLEDILRWMTVEVSERTLRDYIYNKSIYPTTLPMTVEELAIEQALATQAIFLAIRQARKNYPPNLPGAVPDLLPWFEPIIAAGSIISQAPNRIQALMMLINGLQPTGITTMAIDRNNLAASLGAAATVAPLLTVQSLDSTNFHNLCPVISPIGQAPYGTPILRVRLTYGEGHEVNVDVKYGALEIIRLPMGQTGMIHLTPLHRFDVGMGGPGQGGSVKVTGGAMGVIIDARGRPLRLPPDPVRRRELHKKWIAALGT